MGQRYSSSLLKVVIIAAITRSNLRPLLSAPCPSAVHSMMCFSPCPITCIAHLACSRTCLLKHIVMLTGCGTHGKKSSGVAIGQSKPSWASNELPDFGLKQIDEKGVIHSHQRGTIERCCHAGREIDMGVRTWQSLSPMHRQNTITKEAWRLVRVITGEASKTHEVDHAILEISRLSLPLKRWADWISK